MDKIGGDIIGLSGLAHFFRASNVDAVPIDAFEAAQELPDFFGQTCSRLAYCRTDLKKKTDSRLGQIEGKIL